MMYLSGLPNSYGKSKLRIAPTTFFFILNILLADRNAFFETRHFLMPLPQHIPNGFIEDHVQDPDQKKEIGHLQQEGPLGNDGEAAAFRGRNRVAGQNKQQCRRDRQQER